jgi:lipopolysaccharide/colanic/teichoic acid biosynthesis glycosyltransferase
MQFDKLGDSAEVNTEGAQSAEVPAPRGVYRRVGKRVIDILMILMAAPILIPVTLIVTVLILTSGHNPLFVQHRVGRGGRVFRMWKFRTMVPNAEAVLRRYLATNSEARAEWDARQKLKKDPRITPFGRFLRKSSLDELPQFWNVLIGDMSIVGPRPMMVDQQELYPGESYYRMRPGITGLWQVSERNEGEFSGRAEFDDNYEKSVTFGGDLAILRKTVGVVVRGTGY